MIRTQLIEHFQGKNNNFFKIIQFLLDFERLQRNRIERKRAFLLLLKDYICKIRE